MLARGGSLIRDFPVGLFSKIFGRRESDGRGGAVEVVPVHPGWAFVESVFADLYPGQTPRRAAKRDSTEPPLWPVAFLGKIASHVRQGAVLSQAVAFRTGAIPGAPTDAGLEGVVALRDPGIEPRPGPFGKVGVILLVGVTGR